MLIACIKTLDFSKHPNLDATNTNFLNRVVQVKLLRI